MTKIKTLISRRLDINAWLLNDDLDLQGHVMCRQCWEYVIWIHWPPKPYPRHQIFDSITCSSWENWAYMICRPSWTPSWISQGGFEIFFAAMVPLLQTCFMNICFKFYVCITFCIITVKKWANPPYYQYKLARIYWRNHCQCFWLFLALEC